MPRPQAPFSPAALAFLRQLRTHNTREWFQPRKARFEALLRQPMLALCEQVADDLRSFAVDHVVPAAKAAKRIYRDVRFSKDKTPYKTTMAALFPRAGLEKDRCAVFYFGVSPDGVTVATGQYQPGPAELAAIRADIDGDPAGYARLLAAAPLVKLFGPCQGERLVKVPKPFAADHPAVDLLRHKQWYFAVRLDPSLATGPGLRRAIVDRFRAATPFVNRLNETVLASAAQQAGDDGRPVRPKPMF